MYTAAIDQGTTSTRFIIFDARGIPVAQDQMEHRQICPQPGWVEHDPMEVWENTQKVMVGAFSKSGLKSSQVVSLGITNQRETVIVWNRHTGKPVYNALVWQDTRTEEFCRELGKTRGEDIRRLTGLPPATYFSASKLRWILHQIPGVREGCTKGEILAGTMDSWILWNLTGGPKGGVHLTDVTNASRTQVFRLETLAWDSELLELFNLPGNILPQVLPSVGDFGTARVLGYEIPVTAILGDQQSALFGQGCFEPGEAKNTYGTGCFLLMNTGQNPQLSTNGLLTTLAYQLPGQKAVYALEGSVAVAGSLIQWLRDNLRFFRDSGEVEALATSVADNGGVAVVPAFSGLFAPWWRPDARGAILGLTRFAHKGHIARAALESTAFQSLDVLEAMAKDAGAPLKTLKVDGGMTVNNLLMQFQADVLGIPVIRPLVAETTALGAALASGLGSGFYQRLEDIKTFWQAERQWNPTLDREKQEDLIRRWHKAVEKSLGWEDSHGF